MTGSALVLILIAAFVHATWNYLAKRAKGGAVFVWLFSSGSVILYLPLVVGVLILLRPSLGPKEFMFGVGSAALHMGYFVLLQRGYSRGDLSLVYPLARATGPTLATLAAILFFGEQPTALALLGGGCIIVGVFFLTGGTAAARAHHVRHSLLFGLITGVFIASYTLWDSYAVSTLLIPPLVLDYFANLGRAVLLTPYTIKRWPQVMDVWRNHRREVVGVAILSPLSYILILTALTFTPVSYVAPAREVSVLIVVVMGTRLLAEGRLTPRLFAASVIVIGMFILATN